MYYENLSTFARKLRLTLPGIQALQILNMEGTTLLSDAPQADEDKLAALSAAVHGAAHQLSRHLHSNDAPRRLLICCDPTAYLITAMNDDYLLGLQIPSEMAHPWVFKTVAGLIADHARQLTSELPGQRQPKLAFRAGPSTVSGPHHRQTTVPG